jgi:hypothetical protein
VDLHLKRQNNMTEMEKAEYERLLQIKKDLEAKLEAVKKKLIQLRIK